MLQKLVLYHVHEVEYMNYKMDVSLERKLAQEPKI